MPRSQSTSEEPKPMSVDPSPSPESEPAPASAPGSASADAIVVRGLSHTYKSGTVALDGVDLEIGTGLFGLLGPNGAGKSTFMRIVCTLIEPSAGSVSVFGHDVVSERRAVRAQLGYLPQDFGAWRLHRTEEALDTLARLSGLTRKAERRTKVAELLDSVGLTEAADRKVKKLSGGMLRRLGIAQALIGEPRLLVVDEPTVGLDPQERIRFRQLMATLSQERTIILSTHIVADLGATCQDLALLDRGRIVFRGSPTQLLSQAAGQVFELTAGKSTEIPPGDGEFEVVSRVDSAQGSIYRGVAAPNRVPPGATLVDKPTLEEGYLAFMFARGRADVVLEAAGEEGDASDSGDQASEDSTEGGGA